MKLTLLLADAAQAVNGKLFVLGGGWTDAGVGPDGLTAPQALAVVVEVSWDQANRPHQLRCALLNPDGELVEPAPGNPVAIELPFEVGRPPGAIPGSPLPVTLAVNIPPLPLQSGRYTWDLQIDGVDEWTATTSFNVRAPGGPVRLAS